MRFHIAILVGAAYLAFAAPFSNVSTHHPLPDGMPNPSPSELETIEMNSHGTLPNGPPPPGISEGGIINLKLIEFNELFEVAFFYQLIKNITDKVSGYRFTDEEDYDFVLDGLQVILAQEELHALDANNALAHDFDSALVLATTFTDVVLGTLQDVVERFALGGDFALTRHVASIIGQEGEQQGWFRVMQGKVPGELPFLTTSDLNFAFTAIQSFVVPGTCPNIDSIPLKTFAPLNVILPPTAETRGIKFSFSVDDHEKIDRDSLWLTYINQQNLPIVEPLHVISKENNTITAKALFPYEAHQMNGLTIAAVTTSEGPFPNAYSVANATVAGPGLFIIK